MKRFLYGLALGLFLGAALVGAARPAAAKRESSVDSTPPTEEREPSVVAVRVTPAMRCYSRIRYALYFGGTLANLLVLALLLGSGTSARLRTLAERRFRNRLAQAYFYYLPFSAAYALLLLPLGFYSGFLLPRQYGLSHESFGGWMADGLKGFGVSGLLAPPVVALLYWTIRRSPRRWWWGFWLASIPLLAVSVFLGPLVIDPLYHHFEPLPNVELRDRILTLAARAGIQRSRVYEMDASRRTSGVNAYVTGLGGSARIVLWDTLLQKLSNREVLVVMAHEMGHYVEDHVPIGLAISIAGSLLLFGVSDRLVRALLTRGSAAWNVSEIGDLASFPALLLVVSLLTFLGSPVEAAVSRTFESRADSFALRLTNDGPAAANAFVKLSELNLSEPDPPRIIEWWMFSHPSLQERIEKAEAWTRAHPGPPTDLQSGRPPLAPETSGGSDPVAPPVTAP